MIGVGLSLLLFFLYTGDPVMGLFFVFLILGIATTYWAESRAWTRATSRDRPQKKETASAAKQS